jgi:hypothetical protein
MIGLPVGYSRISLRRLGFSPMTTSGGEIVANGKMACAFASAPSDIVISPATLAEIITGGGASAIFSVRINFLGICETSAFGVPSTSIALFVDDGLLFAFTAFIVFGGNMTLVLLN